jgi:tetratricopeptide (TPR) repeat protein
MRAISRWIWIEPKQPRRATCALLDSEPNQLSEQFRQALLHHTGGHALFTVELLRTLQERGDLHLDENGRWVAQSTLDWGALPARVEGVIEERIGRLEAELRDELRVASVEGEDFAAQVIARVQATRERQLLRNLSEEPGKRHRLVREQGETRVGQQMLSRYQFAHALFQRYLYDGLSAGEKRLLHGEIAHVLEELHADSIETVTVQLARHYTEAGDNEKASQYLLAAGDRARRLYANAEAEAHYRRALSLLPASDYAMASRLYEGLGDVLALIGQFDQAHTAYQSARPHLAQQDTIRRARLERKDGNAWHAGDAPKTLENGHAALASWSRTAVPNQFKWTALIPLLAVAVAQADIPQAVEYARGLLLPPQLRLPPALETTLQTAITAWEENQSENACACLLQTVQQAEQMGYL